MEQDGRNVLCFMDISGYTHACEVYEAFTIIKENLKAS